MVFLAHGRLENNPEKKRKNSSKVCFLSLYFKTKLDQANILTISGENEPTLLNSKIFTQRVSKVLSRHY